MRRITLFAVVFALLIGGCGDSSDSASEATSGGGSAGGAYVVKADRICAAMIADSRRMGDRFRRLPRVGVDSLTLTTEELVKPAIPILESSARRLRALEPRAESVEFESYVSLFDPIVSLARERAMAGDAGDAARAREVELLSLNLSVLQRNLAREAGLETCDVDFIETLSTAGGPR
jgi:hypothetical protein